MITVRISYLLLPKAISIFKFNEFNICRGNTVQLDVMAIKCLNRGDQGSKLFSAKITSQRRHGGSLRKNLNRMIPSNATHALCNFNETSRSYEVVTD